MVFLKVFCTGFDLFLFTGTGPLTVPVVEFTVVTHIVVKVTVTLGTVTIMSSTIMTVTILTVKIVTSKVLTVTVQLLKICYPRQYSIYISKQTVSSKKILSHQN